jgi:plastocyanin
MNKTLIMWIAVIVLVIAGIMLFKNSNNTPNESNLNPGEQSAAPGVNTDVTPVATTTVNAPVTVKSFAVSGKPFSFTPSTLTVNKGDTVRITFTNEQGAHDWVIDEFNAQTKVLQAGQSETIEFVADKSGSFEYYCSVGTHRQMGMKGTLVVK